MNRIIGAFACLLLTAGIGGSCDQKVFIGCTIPPFSAETSKCLETITQIPKGPLTRAELVKLTATLRRSELRLQRCGLNGRNLYETARKHCIAQAKK